MHREPDLFNHAKAVRCFGSEEHVNDLLTQFLPQIEARMEALRIAIRAGERAQVHKAIHWLRGGLSYLFSPAAERVCLKLVDDADSGSLSKVEATLDELQAVIGRLHQHLSQLVAA